MNDQNAVSAGAPNAENFIEVPRILNDEQYQLNKNLWIHY